MSEVEISVGGRRYTIACNPGEEKDVLLASEKLDKEAEHIVKNIGKVADVKLGKFYLIKGVDNAFKMLSK